MSSSTNPAPSDPTALVAELRKRASKEPLLLTDPPQETDLAKLLNGAAATIEAVTSDETFAADSVIDNAAAEIAGLVGPSDEAQAVEAAVKRALVFMRSLANLRLQRAEARATAAEAERDRLREALEPFALFADALNEAVPDNIAIGIYAEGAMRFGPSGGANLGDLRRARAALSTAKERGDG